MARPRSTALARREKEAFQQLEIAAHFPEGSISLLGMKLKDEDLEYSAWENIGRSLGHVRRWVQFALGDWLNFGAELYGETAFQATESTPSERYDIASRITGLAPETLKNYASVCGRVPMSRRRIELDWSHHEVVASLEPEDQDRWLQEAVDQSWRREDLRAAIRAEQNPALPASEGAEVVGPELSRKEKMEAVIKLAYLQAQPLSDGDYRLPAEVYAQFAEILGEE